MNSSCENILDRLNNPRTETPLSLFSPVKISRIWRISRFEIRIFSHIAFHVHASHFFIRVIRVGLTG
jgi:hypothetical protein